MPREVRMTCQAKFQVLFAQENQNLQRESNERFSFEEVIILVQN